MAFRITGLDPSEFRHLTTLNDAELALHGVMRVTATSKPGFPDRVELRDAEPGETLLLLNYVHQPANTPFRASHAIYVREAATAAYDRTNEIPEPFTTRPMSLRAFSAAHMLIDAALATGQEVRGAIETLLADPDTQYLHAHYATPGCYAARIDRA